MLKIIKRILITMVILTILALIAIWMYSYHRTYFNEDNEIGNTAGNIINGGLFCEQGDKIYYSNDFDNGNLYVMNSDLSGSKKVNDDKAVYINADDNYIYYVRANNTRENNSGSILNFNNTGVYRINRNGDNMKSITDNPGSFLTLKGNFLYFQLYDVNRGLYLYRYQIDGKDERLLIQDAVIPSAVTNDSLYYAGFSKDHNLNKLDLNSFTTDTVREGSFAYPVFQGNYIYYINIDDNYTIYRMKMDGSENIRLVNERTSTFNITGSGKYLYYQVDDTKNNKICRLDLGTTKVKVLKKGNYKQINITGNYVFFKDFDNKNTYVMSADGSAKVDIFHPSDSEKK